MEIETLQCEIECAQNNVVYWISVLGRSQKLVSKNVSY